MRFTATVALLWAAYLLMCNSVHAQPCRPSLSATAPVMNQWQGQSLAQGHPVRLRFRVEAQASETGCPFLIGFQVDDRPDLQAFVTAGPLGEVLQDLPQATLDRMLVGRTDPVAPVGFDLDLVVTPSPLLRSGVVALPLTVNVYDELDPGGAVSVDRVTLPVILNVPAHAVLEVDSDLGRRPLEGTAGLIDLGRISSGVSGRAQLTLDSNTEVFVSLALVHGALRHAQRPNYEIPYDLRVGSQWLPGQDGGADWRMAPGETLDLEVMIGEIEEMVAGSYSDSIVVTIRAP